MAVSTKLASTAPLISVERLKKDDWKIKEINEITLKLIERIKQVISLSGTSSPSLDLCLAILHFIVGDYASATQRFESVLKSDPGNYSIWNKVAATKAHLGDFEGARVAYHKALDTKPNYVRSWTNLAINYHSMDKPEVSVSFLLNALALNPDARHLWSYLESVFISQKAFDRLQMVGPLDISRFADMHNVKTVRDLPKPNGQDYVSQFQHYVLNSDVDEWVRGFEPKGQAGDESAK